MVNFRGWFSEKTLTQLSPEAMQNDMLKWIQLIVKEYYLLLNKIERADKTVLGIKQKS
jgi:hypothetical protein